MIYFFSDNHYNAHPGKKIYDALPQELKDRISFYEDDWTVLEEGAWVENCELLVLNMIGGSCGVPYPEHGVKHVERFVKRGGSVVLLHGSSAAFWRSDWWRKLVGWRWVRPNDPDGITASTHPIEPTEVRLVAGSTHPLTKKLSNFSMPADEVYIRLHDSSVGEVLMESTISEGTFPQCMVVPIAEGGEIYHFLPGHAHAAQPGCVKNIVAIIEYALSNKR